MTKHILTLQERFFTKVKKSETSDCHEWTGVTDQRGYGKFHNTLGAGRYPHRVAYELSYGPFDYSLLVCHKCDNPSCVNPSHLFLGTHKENMQDCVQKHRIATGARHGRVVLEEAQVRLVYVLLASGALACDIAEWFGVSKTAIHLIRYGKNWRKAYAT